MNSGRRRFLTLGAGLAVQAAPIAALARPALRGGALKHVGIEPPTFDIHAPAGEQAQLVSSFVRRGLFKFVSGSWHDPSDFTLVPDLARSVVGATDGRSYTVTLRQGVRWERRAPVHGRELVAADVKYSLERALAKSPYASLLGPVEAIEIFGRYALRVHLRSPFTPFLHNLAEPWTAILPPEVEDSLGGFRSATSLIGCGPFVLERYEPGVKVIFVRNRDYHRRGLPRLDRVEWIFLRDRSTRLSLFRAGELDIPSHDGRISSAEAETLMSSASRYPVARWDMLGGRTLAMRVDRPPFSDARVRQALSLAVDRAKWGAPRLGLDASEPEGPVPSTMRRWSLGPRALGEGARYLIHDPGRARRLLAEAGFPNGLRVKCASWPGHGPEHVEALKGLAADLRAVGVDLVVTDAEYESYARDCLTGKYEEATWDSSPLFTEVDSYLFALYRSGLVSNRSRVDDPQLDALLDAQRLPLTRSGRKKVIDDIQRRALAQMYYLHAPIGKSLAAWAPRVKNYAPRNSLDRGAQLEVVWVEGA
ncbi:MAG TPA: ABC transporter substrate-binding protein [Candidatus Methylomirabilis sp.]|nr:ABC transporter substrate-binding protein [Candidatus Methylomirabilis sp.]